MTRPVIDAHHHFWDPATAEYPWMTGPFVALRQRFGPSELAPLLIESSVTGTIVVQARQELSETTTLLDVAGRTDWIAGVVGWVDLTSPDVAETISRIREGLHGEHLVGVRHLVHDESDSDWLLRTDVQRGLAAVGDARLVFDLLVRTRELPAATETVRRFPGIRFVLDHLAKPPIASRQLEPWASAIRAIAASPNVACKVSGMVTEADWSSWSPSDLAPFLETVVECFGAERLMFGSDWPVCTLAASYREVVDTTVTAMSDLVGSDIDWILSKCASGVYGLDG